MPKSYKLAEIENYLESLKEIAEKRRKTTPKLAKTSFENESVGYLKALDTIIKDLDRILEA